MGQDHRRPQGRRSGRSRASARPRCPPCRLRWSSSLAPQTCNLILAQWLRAFDAQAFDPLLREITLEVPVEQCGEHHCDQRPKACERHVFMTVPDVALRAQVGHPEVTPE